MTADVVRDRWSELMLDSSPTELQEGLDRALHRLAEGTWRRTVGEGGTIVDDLGTPIRDTLVARAGEASPLARSV